MNLREEDNLFTRDKACEFIQFPMGPLFGGFIVVILCLYLSFSPYNCGIDFVNNYYYDYKPKCTSIIKTCKDNAILL